MDADRLSNAGRCANIVCTPVPTAQLLAMLDVDSILLHLDCSNTKTTNAQSANANAQTSVEPLLSGKT